MRFETDFRGQVTAVGGAATLMAYDGSGRLISLTDAEGDIPATPTATAGAALPYPGIFNNRSLRHTRTIQMRVAPTR